MSLGTIQTVRDFMALPGVYDVKGAHPRPGFVTIHVTTPGLAAYLNASGLLPIGMTVVEEVLERGDL